MFTAAFSIAPAAGFNVFTLTDISSYVDEPQNTFSGRRIWLKTTDNRYLVPVGTTTDYVDFPYSGGDSITIDCMSRDYAVELTFECISTDPQSGSVYEVSLICGFESFNANGEYGVESALTARPSVTQNKNYWLSLGQVQLDIYNQQQKSAQWAMNRAAYLLSNQLTNF